MSSPVMTEARWEPPRRLTLPATLAASAARLLIVLPPAAIKAVLGALTVGSSRPSEEDVLEWRNAVNTVSRRCAGNGCLQRSVAVVLLGAAHMRAPVWSTGFRLRPFTAHAWVEVDGSPVGEPAAVSEYQPVMTMEPRWRGSRKEGCA